MLEAKNFDRRGLIDKLNHPFNDKSLVRAFEVLTIRLKPFIHSYDTIIGDDISGRLPTLVIAELARKKRDQMGLMPPQIFFINAGSNVSIPINAEKTLPKIRDLIKNHTRVNRKILIITEYVYSGDSISGLANEFRKQNLKPDLCILDSVADPDFINSLAGYKKFVGAVGGDSAAPFYLNSWLTGLLSVGCSPIAAKRGAYSYEQEASTIQARRDMKLIAAELWKLIE